MQAENCIIEIGRLRTGPISQHHCIVDVIKDDTSIDIARHSMQLEV